MAKEVLTNAHITVNGVDLSEYIRQVEVTYNADQVEKTTMGDAAHNFKGGLKDQGFALTFAQDFAANKVDATLAPLLGADPVTVLVKAVDAAVGATNPSYSGSMMLAEYSPIQGSVGDLAEAPVRFVPGDGTGVVRATS